MGAFRGGRGRTWLGGGPLGGCLELVGGDERGGEGMGIEVLGGHYQAHCPK